MTVKLFETDAEIVNGVVIVAHGLNNKPEVMDSLIGVLVGEGFHCARLSLYRDGPSNRVAPEVLAEGWIGAVADGYDEVSKRYEGLPIYNLSYSLSALVTISLLEARSDVTFERIVLLAPPVALTRGASLVRLLTPLARFGVVLPSAAPKEVRARSGTPLSEYAGMLRLVDKVQVLENRERLGGIRTRVFLDVDDELVRYQGVLDWLGQNRLNSWRAEEVPDRAPDGFTYSHLMVVEKSLGQTAWMELTQEIVAHFKARL
jgi:hypothetical protein